MGNEDKVVALAGATGLVGGLCLRELLGRQTVKNVVVLGRRAPPVTDARLQTRTVDFAALPLPQTNERIDAALCALGTTIKAAGSQEAFRAVDQHAVVAFATWARAHNCRTFVLVSSVGAAAKAGSFYLRVKGETEAAVRTLGFDRVVILRPGVLLGRRSDSRRGEAVAQAVLPIAGRLLLGSWDRFRAIEAGVVAKAMAKASLVGERGTFIWHNRDILTHAQT